MLTRFNQLAVALFVLSGVLIVSGFSMRAIAQSDSKTAAGDDEMTLDNEEQVYQLKNNPQAELDRLQKESAPLDLEQETSVVESGQPATSETRMESSNQELRRYLQKGFEVQLGYSAFNSNSSASGATGDNQVSLSAGGSPTLGARYSSIRNDGFGYTAGFHIDPSYSVSNVKVNGITLPSAVATSGNLFLFVPEANITYEFEHAYLFLGGNYSLPTGTLGNATFTGGIGGQAGLGWYIGQQLANLDFGSNALTLEILVQTTQISLTNIGSSNLDSNNAPVFDPITGSKVRQNTSNSAPIQMAGAMVRMGLNFR